MGCVALLPLAGVIMWLIWDFRMEAQLWRNAALKTQNDIKPNRVFALVNLALLLITIYG